MPIDPESAPDNLTDEEMAQLEAEYASPTAGASTRQSMRLPHPGIGSMPFPSDVDEAAEIGDINRAQAPALATMAATGPAGVLSSMGTAGRVLSHPVTVGAGVTGVELARGRPFVQAAGTGILAGMLGSGARIHRAGRKFDALMKRSAERFGRSTEKAVEGAVSVPGRTLTKPSAPPFMPKGKMRLDLGPREQTTMTGTVETARPLTPKPQFSSTGAVPRGKVTQPNVRVRAEGSMDPAKQGPATASGPVTPRSTPAGKPAAPAAPRAETPPAADDDVGAYIERTVRDTGLSKRQIIDAVQIRYGATHEQARTAVDAIFGLKGLTRR